MSEFEPHIPTERTIKHCEFILSNLDKDIADSFREYGYGTYKPDSPLLLQLLRNLRAVTDALDRIANINNSGSGDNKSSDN